MRFVKAAAGKPELKYAQQYKSATQRSSIAVIGP